MSTCTDPRASHIIPGDTVNTPKPRDRNVSFILKITDTRLDEEGVSRCVDQDPTERDRSHAVQATWAVETLGKSFYTFQSVFFVCEMQVAVLPLQYCS